MKKVYNLKEGYKAMSEQNLKIAREAFHVQVECLSEKEKREELKELRKAERKERSKYRI